MSDLLVKGEIGIDLPGRRDAFFLEGLHEGKQDCSGCLVVDEAGLDVAVHEDRSRVKRDHVAGLDAELCGIGSAFYVLIQHHADVLPVVGKHRAQFLLGHMDGVRGAADGPGKDLPVPVAYPHVFRDAVEGVQPAHGADVQGAVCVYVPHHQADVVEVRSHGDGVALTAGAGDHAAFMRQVITVSEVIQDPAEYVLDLLVLTGCAVDRDKFSEDIKTVFLIKVHGVRSFVFCCFHSITFFRIGKDSLRCGGREMYGGIFRKEPYCAKIASKEADAMTRIERITEMERCLDASRAAVDRLAEAFDAYEAVQKDYVKLSEYYGSAKWNDDYDADAAGKLPAGLKRGVLSEDAVYDLITDNHELAVRMLKTVVKALENQAL